MIQKKVAAHQFLTSKHYTITLIEWCQMASIGSNWFGVPIDVRFLTVDDHITSIANNCDDRYTKCGHTLKKIHVLTRASNTPRSINSRTLMLRLLWWRWFRVIRLSQPCEKYWSQVNAPTWKIRSLGSINTSIFGTCPLPGLTTRNRLLWACLAMAAGSLRQRRVDAQPLSKRKYHG